MSYPTPFWDDDDDRPEFGHCHECGCDHRLDLGCMVAEKRGRMVLVTILTGALLLAGLVGLLWGLL